MSSKLNFLYHYEESVFIFSICFQCLGLTCVAHAFLQFLCACQVVTRRDQLASKASKKEDGRGRGRAPGRGRGRGRGRVAVENVG